VLQNPDSTFYFQCNFSKVITKGTKSHKE